MGTTFHLLSIWFHPSTCLFLGASHCAAYWILSAFRLWINQCEDPVWAWHTSPEVAQIFLSHFGQVTGLSFIIWKMGIMSFVFLSLAIYPLLWSHPNNFRARGQDFWWAYGANGTSYFKMSAWVQRVVFLPILTFTYRQMQNCLWSKGQTISPCRWDLGHSHQMNYLLRLTSYKSRGWLCLCLSPLPTSAHQQVVCEGSSQDESCWVLVLI